MNRNLIASFCLEISITKLCSEYSCS